MAPQGARHPALVTAEKALAAPDAWRFVDASWHLDKARNADAEYAAAHIPGAVRFDLDKVCNLETDLPHMLPMPEAFAAAIGGLGIDEATPVVLYEAGALFSTPRVRWTFETMGARNVMILDGGLPAWREAGGQVTDAPAQPMPRVFTTDFDPQRVVGFDEMQGLVADGATQIVDARPAGRFEGTAPEPRPGLRCGAMPGAINVPASDLIADGSLKDTATLAEIFAGAGLDLSRPIVTTCGSGVTAAILHFGLEAVGAQNVRLYDGSWAEWGQPHLDTPVIGAA